MADPEVERFFARRERKSAEKLAVKNPEKLVIAEDKSQLDGETRLKYQEILGYLELWAGQSNERDSDLNCQLNRVSDTTATFKFSMESVAVELFHGLDVDRKSNTAIRIQSDSVPIELILNAVGGTIKWVPTNLIPRNYVGDSRHVASQILSVCQNLSQ